MDPLLTRLRAAGFDAVSADPAPGGVVAMAGMATLRDGSRVFAKTLHGAGADLFEIEAEGLRVLGEAGATTPDVLGVTPDLLVLEPLCPRPDDNERFWEDLGRIVASVHAVTGERFGWHRDGWLGRLRQDNTWDEDGHAFFAQRRILRWLPEPLVEAAFDAEERRSLERLCAALPDLLPPQRPVLTHGDLWRENILTDQAGGPALIDPAVSYSWAEADLSMLWCTPRPPASDRFFAAYNEAAPLPDGWRQRMRVFHLRELLSDIAHDDGGWGAAQEVREIIAPFARSQ
ncbi:fructosamine kinase family protein [Nonomuraea polychroma]|uniref:fructosamine kinase family protein n=1 Tax=Nonomuraea polychroma TaxID=46176 RepID=UPI003D93E701